MVRPAVPKALLAVLLITLSAVPAAQAQGEGHLTVSKLAIEHCDKMFGGCTWKLSCGVGQTPASDLLAGAKLSSAGSIPVGKVFPVPAFPVEVSCTLSLDDGWFGTSWKKVADGSVKIESGGDFSLGLGPKGKEAGQVLIAADSLEVAAPPAAAAAKGAAPKKAAAGPRQWLSIFHGGEEGHAVVLGLEGPAFKARVDQLAAQSVKPVHLKVYKENGKILYSGIFRSLPDAEVVFLTDIDWEAFKVKYRDYTGHGKRLTDIETYDNGGKTRLYATLFQTGGGEYAVWSFEEKPFMAKWNEMTAQGLRLTDLAVYHSGKKLFYVGVFRSGSGSYAFWPNLSWDALAAKAKDAAKGGTELVQVATYTDGPKRLYAGVLKNVVAPSEALVPALDTAGFAAKWREMTAKGMRLTDLETIPDE